MAESMGIYGVRVEDPAQLKSAIAEAFAHQGPAVIDVVTDRQELVMPPEIKLEQAKGFSLMDAQGGAQWPGERNRRSCEDGAASLNAIFTDVSARSDFWPEGRRQPLGPWV